MKTAAQQYADLINERADLGVKHFQASVNKEIAGKQLDEVTARLKTVQAAIEGIEIGIAVKAEEEAKQTDES